MRYNLLNILKGPNPKLEKNPSNVFKRKLERKTESFS